VKSSIVNRKSPKSSGMCPGPAGRNDSATGDVFHERRPNFNDTVEGRRSNVKGLTARDEGPSTLDLRPVTKGAQRR